LGRVFFNDESFHERLPGFDILRIHPDVADLRICHRNQLTFVRRVREDFLVAGHAGVEHDLTHRLALGAERYAWVILAISECEYGGFSCHQVFPTVSVGLMIE
jgi:hypothetical protein